MWLMCDECHEPRDAYDTTCKKCGKRLPNVIPCRRCNGKGFIQGDMGPEDCPDCEGIGGRYGR